MWEDVQFGNPLKKCIIKMHYTVFDSRMKSWHHSIFMCLWHIKIMGSLNLYAMA